MSRRGEGAPPFGRFDNDRGVSQRRDESVAQEEVFTRGVRPRGVIGEQSATGDHIGCYLPVCRRIDPV